MAKKLIAAVSAMTLVTALAISAVPAQATPNTTKKISMQQVKKNNNANRCWTVVNGKVYNVTRWINQHPGGSARILALCGKDGTAMFTGQHGGQATPESALRSFQIGVLRR